MKILAAHVLLAQNVLSCHLTANEAGRLTLLFGKSVAGWQIDAMVKQLEQKSAIKGLTHVRVDIDSCTMH